MKKFILTITAIFICTIAYAHTINWWDEDRATLLQTTTCDSGESITPPTAPYKYGYHFKEWAGYTPIEYLESTGTQYIDTGIKTNGYDRFVSYWYSIKDTGNYALYGGGSAYYANQGERSFFWDKNTIQVVTPTSANGSVVAPIFNNFWYSGKDYVIDDNLSYIKINDVTSYRNVSDLFQPKYNFCIFGTFRDLNKATWLSSVRLKQFKWYRNDILVRDFIPVLDKNGVPCMYDKVEKKFYYNAGTGQFIAGPVIGE